MATVVQTVSKCGICSAVDIRPGAEGETPPVGWSVIRMTAREEGAGWTHSFRLIDDHICGSCSSSVVDFIDAERRHHEEGRP